MAAHLMSKYGLSPEDAIAEVLSHAEKAGVVRMGEVEKLKIYMATGYDSTRSDAMHSEADANCCLK